MRKFFYSSRNKLDQHFLSDQKIAEKIVKNLSFKDYNTVVEIGPGLGILTTYLLNICDKVFLIEIDEELISFLRNNFPLSKKQIIHKNFLEWSPEEINLKNFALIGNFPYSISSQILFHILKYNQYIPECVGMFQKEVAERIVSHNDKKTYGILSVLVQTFYDVKYLFTVDKNVFFPVPNVMSAVLFLKRKKVEIFNKDLLFKCVKISFNQRRKILKNSLKSFKKKITDFYNLPFLNKRAEQLSVREFLQLTKEIEIRK
ncbi:16S rRNA (adenine(1518)-N(6)/adenine(1519)-N(6))-dimethyltransferase RsmA [Blattabacterium cuenoti]|uniref:16S rRNA (adenine(1518)-N(6)/adenine(1519)-N(6))- dimethyltransferase RsmA n=1 Tax=Blattabacterium cuenoti TaxID=1653831 RepID=UPI00163CF35B|nr:16S rRNA (adenine(1518)-N(6)/adenine(1519)-N(6))-dimethyltransferase RsmA [Blattabacterium cuenoti]